MDQEPDLPTLVVDLCQGDPLLKLLNRVPGRAPWRAFALSLCIYAVLGVGIGWAISLRYLGSGVRCLPIFDRRELPLALFVSLVAGPTIWTLYESQPRWILQVFAELSRNGVIVRREYTSTVQAFLRQMMCQPLNRRRYFVMAVVTGLAGGVLVSVTTYPAHYVHVYGFDTACFLVNPAYFWLVSMPLILALPLYMITWLFVRHAATVVCLTRIYDLCELRPVPFHPDRCNGLAPVGSYSIRTAYVAVFYVSWLFIMTLFPTFFGVPIRLDPSTVLPLVMYPILVPSIFICPVWATHAAMKKAKHAALEAVALDARSLLSETDTVMRSPGQTEEVPASISVLKRLDKKRQLIEKGYQTWPFRLPHVGRFSVAAAVPWLYYAASLLRDVYRQR